MRKFVLHFLVGLLCPDEYVLVPRDRIVVRNADIRLDGKDIARKIRNGVR